MNYEPNFGDEEHRPCIFFDSMKDLRQALEDLEEAEERREREEAARGTLALFEDSP